MRAGSEGRFIGLGKRVFRKQILRLGRWRHPRAPGGILEVTSGLIDRVIANFQKGVRDSVPIPLGHEADALSSAGEVIGLERGEDGSLWGVYAFSDDEVAEKVSDGRISGTSALIALDHEDNESGERHGPVLIHAALTNAPWIKGLAPFEAVALGESASEDAVVIALSTEGAGGMEELLKLLKEKGGISDDELRTLLEEHRPSVLASPQGDGGGEGDGEGSGSPDVAAITAAARDDARAEVLAALSEKGIIVNLSEAAAKEEEDAVEVDITKHPAFVQLSEKVSTLETENETAARERIERQVDDAIKGGRAFSAQREALVEIGLSEGGSERLSQLILPEGVSAIDLSERGVADGRVQGEALSGDDAKAEAQRLIDAYGVKAGKSGGES